MKVIGYRIEHGVNAIINTVEEVVGIEASNFIGGGILNDVCADYLSMSAFTVVAVFLIWWGNVEVESQEDSVDWGVRVDSEGNVGVGVTWEF